MKLGRPELTHPHVPTPVLDIGRAAAQSIDGRVFSNRAPMLASVSASHGACQ